LADNEHLVFFGSDKDAVSQIYRVNVRTHKLDQLSKLKTQLVAYDITPSGKILMTLSKTTPKRLEQEPICRREGCLVRANAIWDKELGAGESDDADSLEVFNIYTGEERHISSPREIDKSVDTCGDRLFSNISPDGRFVVRTCRLRNVSDWPLWWTYYSVIPDLQICWNRGNPRCGEKAFIIDSFTGSVLPLTDAPFVEPWNLPSLWIDGGRYLILPLALESLSDISPEEIRERAKTYSVLLFDPYTRKSTLIARLPTNVTGIKEAAWNEKKQVLTVKLTVEEANTTTVLRFGRTRDAWHPVKDGASERAISRDSDIKILVEESLNKSPVLKAFDTAINKSRQLLDPNAWLTSRWLGQVQSIAWNTKMGQRWTGGLYLPPGFDRTRRYPLMLQTHGFNPELFSLHGIGKNFPGQALAAKDIVVLQVKEEFQPGVLETPQEWHAVQAGYEAAVDHLEELGIIDRNRVGIQGWSRSGPHMGYTITHSDYSFAAGAFTNTGDFGWWWYLSAGAPENLHSFYGSRPFGEGMAQWLQYSPSFNLDRIRTPMLLWEATGVTGIWDWYISLRRLAIPVELWLLPDAPHEVFQVGQVVRTNQLLVDWFDFWLNAREDSDPSKSEQYARWGKLREQGSALLQRPRRPLLQWSAAPAQ
jgi:hypothetical protein